MRTTLFPLFVASCATALSPPSNYVNTAIARTVELVGATTQFTTQYNAKSTTDSPGDYYLALGGTGDDEPAWWEVSVGGQEVEVKHVDGYVNQVVVQGLLG
jgi:oligosaccharyltransferase complex subunit alpha (ribophorin I)